MADLVNVRFRNETRQNLAASKQKNRPVFDDYEVCEIRMPGNKQTIGVFPAHEAEPNATRLAGQSGKGFEHFKEGETVTYAKLYNEQYRNFKAGAVQTTSGTPLSELTFLTQAKRAELQALSIQNAEQLAALDGRPLQMLGPGGRELKNQAVAYLAAAEGSADTVGMALTIAQQAQMIKELQDTMAQFSTVRTNNKWQREQGQAEKRVDEHMAQFVDDGTRDEPPLDPDGNPASDEGQPAPVGTYPGEEGYEPPDSSAVDDTETAPTTSPFADMTRADIKNWLKDAGGEVPKGNVSLAVLVEAAEARNAELAKQDSEAA